jgi:hypothetical protein
MPWISRVALLDSVTRLENCSASVRHPTVFLQPIACIYPIGLGLQKLDARRMQVSVPFVCISHSSKESYHSGARLVEMLLQMG